MKANRLWGLGAVIAMVAIVALGWVLGVSPKLAEAEAAAAELANVEAQNAAQEAILVTLRAQFDDLNPLLEELQALRLQVPGAPLTEDFIDYIRTTAADAGVTISTITLLEPTAYAEEPDPEVPEGFYYIEIAIEVGGDNEQILQFVGGLQRSERVFLASAVDYSPGSGGRAGGIVTGYLFVLLGPDTTEAPVE